MKKKFLLISLIVASLLTGCVTKVDNTDKPNTDDITIIDSTEKDEIKYMDDIYGMYAGKDGDIFNGYVEVFNGKDEKHIDFDAFFHRQASFYINDLEIIKNEDGELIATRQLEKSDEEEIFNYFKENQNLDDAKVNLTIKDGKVKVEFNKELMVVGNVIEREKTNLICITEEEKEKALKKLSESDFKNINEDVFEVIKDTENYLVVRFKCYILKGEGYMRYYSLEGSEGYGMYKYYNIDKKNGKILNLNEIIKNVDDLNEYIYKAMDEKKENWNFEEDTQWPYYYQEFKGIGNPEYFENYFLVDEEKETIKIRCLGYPNEALRAVGDLCIEVPFEYFNLN